MERDPDLWVPIKELMDITGVQMHFFSCYTEHSPALLQLSRPCNISGLRNMNGSAMWHFQAAAV